jgi:hypothetical protein
MESRNKWLIGLLCGQSLLMGAPGISGAEVLLNPVKTIVERNAFGLVRAVEPTVLPPKSPGRQPTVVRITGVTSLFPQPLALFEISESAGGPVKKVIMAEGQHTGDVEVMHINVEHGRVTIRNGTVVTNLSLGTTK